MRGGTLNHIVEIYTRAQVDDGFAARDGDDVLVLRTRAKRTDMSDGERFRSGIIAGEMMTRFVVRASNKARQIVPEHWLVCEARRYDVIGIKELQGERSLEITTRYRA